MENFTKGVTLTNEKYDGRELKILIVHTRWNYKIVEALVNGAIETMTSQYNVSRQNIITESVSGSYELPIAAKNIISGRNNVKYDAVICIGVLIKGSTMHFEYIADAVSHGIMRVGLDTGVPCVFGVLTCLTDEQALERAGLGSSTDSHNHGIDWGHCAVELGIKNLEWQKGK
nr:14893_t:CDS:1 [Entrophospora candida]CAG8571839.1 5605_t:CDS:1 [Entrophospora candida]